MKISKVFCNGKKRLYKLKTRSGFEIKASANHPFRKLDDWYRLDQLSVGDRIATPRKLSLKSPQNTLLRDEIILPKLVSYLKKIKTNPNVDIIPKEVWKIISSIKEVYNLSWRAFAANYGMAYCGSTLFKCGLSRDRMKRVVSFMPSPELKNLAESDVFWDEIVSITPLKVEEVYDATIPGTHNFVANDIVVHNSLEQDSDVVLFIYREDRYRSETTRKNIADIIIAKHRNGPVGKIELYFDDRRVSFKNIEKTLQEQSNF